MVGSSTGLLNLVTKIRVLPGALGFFNSTMENMGKYNYDYMTRCEICGKLIKFDNPFLAEYERVCKDKGCVKKFEDKKLYLPD